MKALVALLFAAPLVVAAIPLALGGDPFVVAIVAGSVAFFALQNLAAATQRRQPRKADPAKIARLERELGLEPPLQGPREWVFTETGDIRPADEAPTEPDIMDTPDALHAVETGCTTMLVAPDVEDCPRPESCVMAHPCRKCGAGRGMWCVGDPYVEQVAEDRRKAYGA